ncbi:ACT domain-containing protein [Youxingia wuxianensis]|uniref:UPF0237 protein H8705_11175 n=1 Tax=Youxingia wuxianensis TaxID=2763678 RepID=A0A926EME7_9FIRM|nr:ACT domain-containing protein [Youxingia wuxianensis]MBC8586143.1 ACT domain-containing protein [Youxingia wuxianensis]
MRAVLTVVGKDRVGIMSKVSEKCADCNANIMEVTQTILQELFCMIMMIDISKLNCELSEMVYQMDQLGEQMGMSIHIMHEDIFNSMHRI